MLSDEDIMEFYRDLFEIVDTKKFLLFYLYSDKLEDNIKTIQKERCDDKGNELWYQMMLEYMIHSPYGKKNGCYTSNDFGARYLPGFIDNELYDYPAFGLFVDSFLRVFEIFGDKRE